MDQRLQLQMTMSQKLIMTPQMQQSIQLLQMNSLELAEMIEQEMVDNPLLEAIEDEDTNDTSLLNPDEQADSDEFGSSDSEDSFTLESNGSDQEPIQSDRNEGGNGEADTDDFLAGFESGIVDGSEDLGGNEQIAEELAEKGTIQLDDEWESYFTDSSDIGSEMPYSVSSIAESNDDEYQSQLAEVEDLRDHLTRQLAVAAHDPDIAEVVAYLIDNLDDDGYLQITVEEAADYFDDYTEFIEEALTLLQGFDPPGIGARNLVECLEIQCRHHGYKDPNIYEILHNHMEDLERRRFRELARKLGTTEQHIQEIVDIITHLDPRPGRQYVPTQNEYVTPDAFIEFERGEYTVRLADDSTPPLRISRRYKEMLYDRDNLTNEELDFVKKKFQAAVWLIKNVEQRKRTLYRVTKAILEAQQEFFEEGITALKPMKLRDIADELGMHEATVCRVVNGKYVQTPRGLFELKYFFSTGLDGDSGDSSNKAVMEHIRALIEDENQLKPLSDQKITDLLKKEHGIKVARRTVAKYREKMGILPTSKRKRVS